MYDPDQKTSQEIERKFLVTARLIDIFTYYPNVQPMLIEQRYLNDCGRWTIRIRRTSVFTSLLHMDGLFTHHLTLKRKITNISCTEIESEITAEFYEQLAEQCGPSLRKTRYKIPIGDVTWEIDLFLNPELHGLIVAEIELSSEDAEFERPWWLGEEVTDDRSYKNNKLCKRIRHNQR